MTDGTDTNSKENIPNAGRIPQANLHGHDRYFPRRMPKNDQHKGRHYLLTESTRRSNELYFNPYKYTVGKVSYHQTKKNKDGSHRKKRSQIREPIYNNVMETMLHYLYLKNGIVGMWNDKKDRFNPFSPLFISIKSGSSYSQVMRVLNELEDHNYITLIKETYTNHKGQKRNKAIQIKFNLQYFYDLDFTEKELEIIKGKEIKKEEGLFRDKKSKGYKDFQRTTKKKAKQEVRNLRDLIQASRRGDDLTDDERALLDKEQPGWNNSVRKKDIYPDFTGISQNREEVLDRVKGTKQISEVGSHHLKSILQKLLKRPPD